MAHLSRLALLFSLLLAVGAVNAGSADEGTCVAGAGSPGSGDVERGAVGNAANRLSGSWQGKAFGGEVEEWWSDFDGRELYGVFRLKVEGKPRFYEFLKMELTGDHPRLIVRHMDSSGVPWTADEIDAEFPLIAATDTCLLFEGLAYDLEEKGRARFSALFEEGESVTHIEFQRVVSE